MNPEETHADTGRTCETAHRQLSRSGLNRLCLSSDSAMLPAELLYHYNDNYLQQIIIFFKKKKKKAQTEAKIKE